MLLRLKMRMLFSRIGGVWSKDHCQLSKEHLVLTRKEVSALPPLVLIFRFKLLRLNMSVLFSRIGGFRARFIVSCPPKCAM